MGSAKWAAARKEGGEQREKREEGTEKGYKREGNGSVPDGRGGREKGRPLGERREERKEKREERDKHNQDERAEEGSSSVPDAGIVNTGMVRHMEMQSDADSVV